MAKPKITILMPCYNAADYIAAAIQSVLQQNFTDFELLIINDGSADNTLTHIKSFNDDRIKCITHERQGVAAALNKGLQHASADYIARFDADDICLPMRLEKQYNFMQANPDCILIGSSAEYIDLQGNYIFTSARPVNPEASGLLTWKICPFIHASVMYNKEAIAAIGYNIHAHSFEDHLLWLQLIGKGKMYNLSEPLIQVRLNPGSLTMDEKKRPASFHRIKNKALQTKHITEAEGNELLRIIRQQNNSTAKQAAYYSLLAKKFLWNNYNPVNARLNMKKAIAINAFDIKDYLLYGLSYLPKNIINNIYSVFASSK